METDSDLNQLFKQARVRIKLIDLTLGGLVILLFTFTFFFGEILFDHLVILERPTRMALLAIYQVAAGLLLLWVIVIPLLRRISQTYIAKQIEHRYPEMKNRLISYLQLDEDVPESIRIDLRKNTLHKLQGFQLATTFTFRSLRTYALAFLGLSLAIYAYALFSPKSVQTSLNRAIYPQKDILPPTRTRITRVEPGEADVLRGGALPIRAKVEGNIPTEAKAFYSYDEKDWDSMPLEVSPQGILSGTLEKVERPVVYYLRAGDTRSERYNLSIIDPPIVNAIEGTYQFPEYTQLEERKFQGGTLKAISGTSALLSATTNVPVSEAFVVRQDGTRVPAEIVEPKLIKFQILVDRNGYYSIELKGEKGHAGQDSPRHNIVATRDQSPQVKILQPGQDIELEAEQTFELSLKMKDDFGVFKASLRLKPRFEEERRIPIPLKVESADIHFRPSYSIGELGLKAGDYATYSVVVEDNLQPRPNIGQSRTFSLRIKESKLLVAMAPPSAGEDGSSSDNRDSRDSGEDGQRDGSNEERDGTEERRDGSREHERSAEGERTQEDESDAAGGDERRDAADGEEARDALGREGGDLEDGRGQDPGWGPSSGG